MNLEALGRRFARVTTTAVVRRPWLWRFFRPLLRRQFDSIAPVWDTMRTPAHLAAYEAALEQIDEPRRVLDLGTGTGAGAAAVKARFPAAEVIGVDLAPAMIAHARAAVPDVQFEVADASHLDYPDGSFDLITLANMIPFFDELARLASPDGTVVIAFSRGAATPIYVPRERLEAELRRRGFAHFADVAAGPGTALLARKGNSPNTSE
jgi:SAM-dependent methyltransferase